MYQVLIVDDERPIREWLVYTLQSNRPDYYVNSASNGLEALEKLRSRSFDLLITDIRMPHMDGLDLLKEARCISKDIGTIILSSYDDFSYVRTAFKHDAVDYLLKTEIDTEKLLNAIDNFNCQKVLSFDERQLSKKLFNFITSNSNAETEFNQILTTFGNLMPQHPYYCFLIKTVNTDDSFKLFFPSVDDTVLKFYLPITDAIYIGCVEVTNRPTTLAQLQVKLLYDRQLQRYNILSLYISSEIHTASNELLSCLKILWIYHDVDFYGVNFFKPPITVNSNEIHLNEQYLSIIDCIKKQKRDALLQQISSLFQFVSDVLFPNINELKLVCIKICEAVYLNNFLSDLTEYHNNTKIISPKITEATSSQQLQETLINYVTLLYSENSKKPENYSPRIAKAIRIIDNCYMDPISLVYVANALYINSEYLSRSFKKEVGINFNIYLNNVRLQHSLEMLEKSNKKITDIAIQTGYQNSAYFSKCFKSSFGTSPQKWRIELDLYENQP